MVNWTERIHPLSRRRSDRVRVLVTGLRLTELTQLVLVVEMKN